MPIAGESVWIPIDKLSKMFGALAENPFGLWPGGVCKNALWLRLWLSGGSAEGFWNYGIIASFDMYRNNSLGASTTATLALGLRVFLTLMTSHWYIY